MGDDERRRRQERARVRAGRLGIRLADERAPGRPAVLALDPSGLLALLEEARLIHDQDALRVAQVRDHVGLQVVAHRVRIPDGAVEELLEAIGGRRAHQLGEVPTVLARHRAEQAAQVGRRVPPRLRPRFARADLRHHRREVLGPRRDRRHHPPPPSSRGSTPPQLQL